MESFDTSLLSYSILFYFFLSIWFHQIDFTPTEGSQHSLKNVL